MKKYLVILPLVGAVSACATQDQSTIAGTLGGAAAGYALDDNDRGRGALVGAAAGAIAGNYIGRNASGNCIYQNPDGSRYTAACP
ncbi:YMGG-like glycine zipper-containing protein [Roseobacter sinensis]|uniref:Glycine zipper 2TM domain-containing protein n=1 Tax=Roseobacter sinensis TaxID=2931391 RepID=A0ABT3BDL7_9RHOB|nr:YMGG-like glycine zipper-containing protein [Roseobacter sp. WL0113]MCV3271660.1 glycine zipper 2TM domain-containing protein [Roseobacter sp. WL0113]